MRYTPLVIHSRASDFAPLFRLSLALRLYEHVLRHLDVLQGEFEIADRICRRAVINADNACLERGVLVFLMPRAGKPHDTREVVDTSITVESYGEFQLQLLEVFELYRPIVSPRRGTYSANSQ